jgi:CubicO group peptidase (beta-lactamase class C family)
MTRIVPRLFPITLLMAGLASVPAEAATLTPRQIEAIRKVVRDSMEVWKAPGATVSIGLEDRVVWTEGFGYADLENHVPARANTAYRTASIGKAITATTAMALAEKGQLDLDAPIQKYCPRYPETRWPITARDLISHTSGIRHYGGPNEQAELFNTRHYDHVSDAIDIFKNDSLMIRPGSDFLYTTWGYVALGCVLEGASHEEFRELVRKTVFVPASMKDTRDDDPRVITPNRARGYILEGGQLKVSRWVDMSSKMAAGGWITTAPDLVRFMNASMAGTLVSPATMDRMLKPYKLPLDGTVDNFGMGWFVDVYRGMKVAAYGGGTPQISAYIFFIPERKIAIAAMFNLEEIPGDKRAGLAQAIAAVILGPD